MGKGRSEGSYLCLARILCVRFPVALRNTYIREWRAHRPPDFEVTLCFLEPLIVPVMDVIQAKAEIDFVELALEDVRGIAVAIAASCTFISVTHECFSFREVEVLSAELVDKGVP